MTAGDALADPSLVIVDVGHGSCAVVQEGVAIAVIDAGRGNALVNYLTSVDKYHIESLIVSHSDEDHLGGILAILSSELFTIHHLLINADSQKDSKIWNDVRAAINSQHNSGKIKLKIGVFAGPVHEWIGPDTAIEAVSPSAYMAMGGVGSTDEVGKAISANSGGVVLRIAYKKKPIVLLCADMEEKTLDDILQNKQDVTSAIVVYPHHGGLTGSGPVEKFVSKLLENARPKAVIFSNGRGGHDNPRPEIVAALHKVNSALHLACTQLSKLCSASEIFDGREEHIIKAFSSGFESGRSCAGSVHINLALETITRWDAHQAFVSRLGSPLCRQALT